MAFLTWTELSMISRFRLTAMLLCGCKPRVRILCRAESASVPERVLLTNVIGAGSTENLMADDVLAAYRAHALSWSDDWSGLDAISELRGHFALLLHDASAERIIAARDREVGILPLYLIS